MSRADSDAVNHTYPSGHTPGLVVPGLVAAYLAAIVGSAVLTGIARRTA